MAEQSARRRALWGALVVVGLLLLLMAWQTVRATAALNEAAGEVALLQDQVAAGDASAAARTAENLADHAGKAHGSTDNVLWAVAARLPFLGDDVDAVRVLARELDMISGSVLPAVVDIADLIAAGAFSPNDGRVDLSTVGESAPSIASAADVLQEASAKVDEIDGEKLIGRLRSPVRQFQARLGTAASTARAADVAVRVLPGMLGAEETRRYLLLVQNNAEARASGGIPGSFAIIEARKGRLRMGEQGSIQDVPPRADPVVRLTEGERSIYPSTLGSDLRDVTLTPDFPRAAQIASELVSRQFDRRIDGVISVDPVMLATLLTGLGNVRLEDGTLLTPGTAVGELLNGVYARYPEEPEQQDLVFEDAARRIFDAFVDGDGSVAQVLDALVSAVDERRLMLWSDDEQEQQQIARTGLSGELPRGGAHVGVYVSDATASKLQFYLTGQSTLRSIACADGRQVLQLRSRFTSLVPRAARGLPRSITGFGTGLPKGTQRVNVRVYGPQEGSFTSLLVDGEEKLVVGGRERERPVATIPLTLGPGESATFVMRMSAGEGVVADPVLSSTPGATYSGADTTTRSACS